ncbi:MAG: hypothetical protein WD270_06220 [Acetobacterales bacterium]
MANDGGAGGRKKEGGHAEASLENVLARLMDALLADRQRATAAAMLDGARAVSAAAKSLAGAEREDLAESGEVLASWLRDNGERIATMGPEEAVACLKGFARRHPAAFAGGGVALGAALAWWLGREGEPDDFPDGEG